MDRSVDVKQDEQRADAAEEASSRNRIGVAAGVGAALIAIAIGSSWIEREPIVRYFARQALDTRHVRASYDVAALGPFAQRLENVRIGDPTRPDLTARVIELRLGYGLNGPHLVAVSAQGLRLNARIVDGRLSLGAVDRLLPVTSASQPLGLPNLATTLTDAQIVLATSAGAITAAISGSGNLADGFRGKLVATGPDLVSAGCTLSRPAVTLSVRIEDHRPTLHGPIDVAAVRCGDGLRLGPGRATVDLAFARPLDRGHGAITLAGFRGSGGGTRFGPLSGRIGVSGDRRRMTGSVALSTPSLRSAAVRGGAATVNGLYRYLPGTAGLVFAGDVALDHAALDEHIRQRLKNGFGGLSTTPLGPIAERATAAVDRLLADASGRAKVALAVGGPAGPSLRLRTVDLTGQGGGHIRVAGGAGIGRTAKGWRVDGRLSANGGDLPAVDAVLAQRVPGGPITGVARIAPYAAGNARLMLMPVRFLVAPDGGTRIDTVATLDGPIGKGRIEGLTLVLIGRIDSRGGVVLDEGCVPIGFRTLRLAGFTLDPARFSICGIDGAPIVAIRNGRVRAGVSLAQARLAGHSGSAPVSMRAESIRLAMDKIALDHLSVRLGAVEAQTRLDVGRVEGVRTGQDFAGTFADAAGQIGHVPLLLSDATGDWRLAGGILALKGAMTVADADPAPRFLPMAARDVALTLDGNRIDATGTLHEPRSGALVTRVTLHHDLASGAGGAMLAVPTLRFGKALQPEALTPLTLGVIANTAGSVTGQGRIDWTGSGTTSSGDFRTDGLDFAAAFGPVRGLAGTIHFSDLLGLVTPPHQEVTIAEINPGIIVTGGTVHYQLVSGAKVRVEDARWPFAGGTLTLEPSLLAFDQASERHLTFRIDQLDAAVFVQQLDFPNIAATGTFDGVLPMIFGQSGGRIEKGRLTARAAGGTLAYVGELSSAEVGTMGHLAFDALKAIRYRALTIDLDGRLDGEIVSRVRFDGVRQATGDASIVARMIHNLPFRFNIGIRAPFRGLLGSARSYADPELLLQNSALPTDGSPGAVAIQPPESERVR